MNSTLTEESNYVISSRVRGHGNIFVTNVKASSKEEALTKVQQNIMIECITKAND
jgi:transcriptional regulator CtsR